VPEILVGFRTPSGELTTLQSFKTMQLPRMVRGKRGAWDPMVCLGWGEGFLKWLNGVVRFSEVDSDWSDVTSEGKDEKEREENADRKKEGVRMWRVKFTPRIGVEAYELDVEGVRDVEDDGEGPVLDHAPPTSALGSGASGTATTPPSRAEVERTGRVGFLPGWYWEQLEEWRREEERAPHPHPHAHSLASDTRRTGDPRRPPPLHHDPRSRPEWTGGGDVRAGTETMGGSNSSGVETKSSPLVAPSGWRI
jgi:hypothetical protein